MQRLLGHEGIVDAFRRTLKRGRLAHAYLFTGPTGVGKRLFALEVARALLCSGNHSDDPLNACGHCPDCIQVEAGTHPDLYQVARPEDAHEFPVKLMQDVCRTLSLKSARGRGKIIIIDEADDLNEESANCFLKTLEEPPTGSVFILIGSTPDRQLPTIVSRCQVIRFAPLADALVEESLRQRDIDDPTLIARLVRLGRGSPGLALALADPELWSFRDALIAGIAQPKIDSVALSRLWMEYVEKAGKESAAHRGRAQLAVGLLIDFFADVLSLKESGPTPRSLDEDRAAEESLGSRFDADQLMAVLERCLESAHQLDRRVQLILVIEALLDAVAQILRP